MGKKSLHIVHYSKEGLILQIAPIALIKEFFVTVVSIVGKSTEGDDEDRIVRIRLQVFELPLELGGDVVELEGGDDESR